MRFVLSKLPRAGFAAVLPPNLAYRGHGWLHEHHITDDLKNAKSSPSPPGQYRKALRRKIYRYKKIIKEKPGECMGVHSRPGHLFIFYQILQMPSIPLLGLQTPRCCFDRLKCRLLIAMCASATHRRHLLIFLQPLPYFRQLLLPLQLE